MCVLTLISVYLIMYTSLEAFYIALGHVNPIGNYYYYYYYYYYYIFIYIHTYIHT